MDFIDQEIERISAWVLLVIGIGLLIWLGILVAIAYYALLLMAEAHRYRQYQLQAGESFDEVLAEHGEIEAETIAEALWGIGVRVPREQRGRPRSMGAVSFGNYVEPR